VASAPRRTCSYSSNETSNKDNPYLIIHTALTEGKELYRADAELATR
jgi:hypothetical protein